MTGIAPADTNARESHGDWSNGSPNIDRLGESLH
jgi:hypothetical protein